MSINNDSCHLDRKILARCIGKSRSESREYPVTLYTNKRRFPILSTSNRSCKRCQTRKVCQFNPLVFSPTETRTHDRSNVLEQLPAAAARPPESNANSAQMTGSELLLLQSMFPLWRIGLQLWNLCYQISKLPRVTIATLLSMVLILLITFPRVVASLNRLPLVIYVSVIISKITGAWMIMVSPHLQFGRNEAHAAGSCCDFPRWWEHLLYWVLPKRENIKKKAFSINPFT